MIVPTYAGGIVDLMVALVLVLTFLGGWKEGAVKGFLGLLAFIVALSLTGAFTAYVLGWMSFTPDHVWRAFFAFLVTMGIILVILHLAFLLPRRMADNVWNGGLIWNALGGIFGVVNCALGLVLMVILLGIYPVLNWLNALLASSNVLNWLVSSLGPIILSMMHITGVY
jgi:uncharacterized membrane protein required for colicin V production